MGLKVTFVVMRAKCVVRSLCNSRASCFHRAVDVGMKEKRACVVAEMKRLQAETEPITKIFEDEDIAKSIQSTRSACLKISSNFSYLRMSCI